MGILSISNFSIGRLFIRQIIGRQNGYHTSSMKSAKAERFRTRIYHYLELHYSDCEYSVLKLSEDMGMSRSQLFRNCKYVLGKSPITLIKHYRLEKSREFLKSGIYNVSEAAYLSGFNSLSYFSKSFKQLYREMPSKWVQ